MHLIKHDKEREKAKYPKNPTETFQEDKVPPMLAAVKPEKVDAFL